MLPLAYGAVFAGAVLLIAGLTASTVPSVAQGKPDRAHAAAAEPPAGGTAAPPTLGNPTSRGAWRATQRAIAKQRGWSLADWNAVIQRESGGDPTARNKTTGAFGLGQLNPENAANPFAPRAGSTAAKYAHLGALSLNPILQIRAMAAYIADTYGTPTRALAHEHAYGWY